MTGRTSDVDAPPATRAELLDRARTYATTVDLAVDLAAVDWEISERAKPPAGACRYDHEADRVTIRLTWDAYRAHGWAQFRETIRHELIHAWEYQQFGDSGHGPRFEREAEALDVRVHCESFTDPRLRATCTNEDCDWSIERYRASKTVTRPERYACGQCGDDYEVRHLATGERWRTAAGYERARGTIGDDW